MIDIGTKKIPLIDAHVHLFPRIDGFKFVNVPTKSAKYGVVFWGDEMHQQMDPAYVDSSSPAEVYLKLMELNGVDKAFIPQTPVYGKHYDYIDSVMKAHPGKFATVGLAYPCGSKERFLKEAEEALDAVKADMDDLLLEGAIDCEWKFDVKKLREHYGTDFERKLGQFVVRTAGNVVIKMREREQDVS